MGQKNVLTRNKKKRADALFAAANWTEAKRLYEDVIRIDKIDVDALTTLSITSRKLRVFDEAESYARQALRIQPQLARAHQALGAALYSQGDRASAIECYRRALHIDPNDADSYYFLGIALREVGAMNDAAAAFRRAAEFRPNFLEALSNLSAALTIMGEVYQASVVLNEALLLAPNSPQVLCNIASISQREGRFKEALEYYERALKVDPESIDTIANIATLLEKTYRLSEARQMLSEGLLRDPENSTLLLLAAKLARRDGQIDKAIELLERIKARNLSPDTSGGIYCLLGQLYDQKSDSRAFQHIVEGNRLTALAVQNANGDRKSYLDKLAHLKLTLTEELRACDFAACPSAPDTPIFLIGFPRSGTTLLEQILDSHPALQALEEKPTVQVMAAKFTQITEGRTNGLASLTSVEIEELRSTYWAEVSQHLDRRAGTILIDKMPLNTVHAYLLWRVFPNAKFILAIRHPCDVCLSCLMQDFAINEAMASFFTLEDTVRTYVGVMSLWQHYTAVLPLDYHRVRYEDLITNLEKEARALLEFLNLEWHDAVLDHTAHARQRGTINTASYHQVTQPIYHHAKYRWKRYASEFEPFKEVLQPFIKYFGYAEEENPEPGHQDFLSKHSSPSTA